jgi:hypothetical protein
VIVVLYRNKAIDEPTAPAVPWRTVRQAGGWCTLYPQGRGGLRLHTLLVVDGDADGMPPAAAGKAAWVIADVPDEDDDDTTDEDEPAERVVAAPERQR